MWNVGFRLHMWVKTKAWIMILVHRCKWLKVHLKHAVAKFSASAYDYKVNAECTVFVYFGSLKTLLSLYNFVCHSDHPGKERLTHDPYNNTNRKRQEGKVVCCLSKFFICDLVYFSTSHLHSRSFSFTLKISFDRAWHSMSSRQRNNMNAAKVWARWRVVHKFLFWIEYWKRGYTGSREDFSD